MGLSLTVPPGSARCHGLYAGHSTSARCSRSIPLQQSTDTLKRLNVNQVPRWSPSEETKPKSHWLRSSATALVAASALWLSRCHIRAARARSHVQSSGRATMSIDTRQSVRNSNSWLSPLAYLATLLSSWWSFHWLGLGAGNASMWLAQVTVFIHTIVFSAVTVLISVPDKDKGAKKYGMMAAVCLLEVLSFAVLSRISSCVHAGVFLLSLSGMAVPYNLLCSSTLMRRRYRRSTWIGAVMVGAGVLCSIPLAEQPLTISAVLLSFAALCFPGLGLIVKEMLLRGSMQSGDRKAMTITSVAALTSASQLIGLFLSPVAYPASATVVAAYPGVGAVALYCLTSGCVRIALIWALRETSALSITLVNALTVPLTASPFPTLGATMGISTALLGIALCSTAPQPVAIVRPQPTKRSRNMNDGTWVPPRPKRPHPNGGSDTSVVSSRKRTDAWTQYQTRNSSADEITVINAEIEASSTALVRSDMRDTDTVPQKTLLAAVAGFAGAALEWWLQTGFS